MKLLISSYYFYPSTGGISTSSLLLAREFTKLGHEVRVVTTTPCDCEDDIGAGQVIRNPRHLDLIRHIAWSDAVVSIHVSIRLNWPLLFQRRPWVVAHHSWLTEVDGSIGWVEKIKHRVIRAARCISVSQAVADHVGGESVIIGPPHDDEMFFRCAGAARERDLLFVGRLVSSKGVNVLLDAIALLRDRGTPRELTIVGDGPELPALKERTRQLRLEDCVHFVGTRCGPALRDTFCAHRLLLVPSITPETFGIVAIEAIACGCVVVGSAEAGGLKDAIGPCGVTFKTGDATALADCVTTLLADPERMERLREKAAEHVEQFTARSVAARYLDVVRTAMAQKWMSASTALLSTVWMQLPV